MSNAHRSPWYAIAVVAALVGTALATPAQAQAANQREEVIPLYPAGQPIPPADALPETSDGVRVRNVSIPTLTVFRPKSAAGDGTAIIIAPGGGFEHLSIASEGTEVARRLANAGVTAIVLKYRLARSAPHPAAPPATTPGAQASRPRQTSMAQQAADHNSSPAALTAMKDGDAAVQFLRAHARQLGIAPDRIGFLGFSAGAVIAMHVAVSPDPASRPDFAAAIYGVMPRDAVVPAAAPPLFLAVAADDKLVGPAASLAIFDAWHAAGDDVEMHVFRSGGHGFGLTPHGTTSDHWIDEYLWWLEQRGLIRRPATAG